MNPLAKAMLKFSAGHTLWRKYVSFNLANFSGAFAREFA